MITAMLHHGSVGSIFIERMVKRTRRLRHHRPGFIVTDSRVRLLFIVVKLSVERGYLSVDIYLSLEVRML